MPQYLLNKLPAIIQSNEVNNEDKFVIAGAGPGDFSVKDM